MISVNFNEAIGSRKLIAIKEFDLPKRSFGRNIYTKLEISPSIGNKNKLERVGNLFGFQTKNNLGLEKEFRIKKWFKDSKVTIWFDPNAITDLTDDDLDEFGFQINLFTYKDSDKEEAAYPIRGSVKIEKIEAKLLFMEVDPIHEQTEHSKKTEVIARAKITYERLAPIKKPDSKIVLLEELSDLLSIHKIEDPIKENNKVSYFYDIAIDLSKIENPEQEIVPQGKIKVSYNGVNKEAFFRHHIVSYLPKLKEPSLKLNEQSSNGIIFTNEKVCIGTLSLQYETKESTADVVSSIEFPEKLSGLFFLEPNNSSFIINHQNSSFDFKVYADTSKIGNPASESEVYKLEIQNYLNRKTLRKFELINFPIYRNNDSTRMNVRFLNLLTNNELKAFGNNDPINIGEIQSLENEFAQSCKILTIKIRNTCKLKDDGRLFFLKPQLITTQTNLLSIASSKDIYIISNGLDESIEFEVRFNYSEARKHINSRINFGIQIPYYEDKIGFYDNDSLDEVKSLCESLNFPKKMFSFIIVKEIGTNWTCVDFGTAAVVVTRDGENEVLDLHKIQKKLLEEEGRVGEDIRLYERGTPFISSRVMFKNSERYNAPKMVDNFYRFSPYEGEVAGAPQNVSPPIKSIIGHRNIYKRFENKLSFKGSDGKESVVNSSMLNPIVVIREVYSQFIKKYIGEDVKNLVFTYPNNFSKNKIRFIESLYADYLGDITIKSISESDAALLEYVASERFNPEEFNSPKNILVYDMGAGTLDISYAQVSIDKTARRSIKILGRIGNNMGGDYLDYTIAKILCDTDYKKENYLKFSGGRSFYLKERIKEFKQDADITDHNNKTINIPLEDTIFNFTNADILSHDFVKKYVDDCTNGIIADLEAFLGFNLMPDRVILTGRASQFSLLFQNLRRILALNDYDIIRYRREESIESKTVVSKGALLYANLFRNTNSFIQLENKNLFYSFGIIYTNILSNDKEYLELLSPRTKFKRINEKSNLKDYESDIVQINLSITPQIEIVQSFSSNTLEDFQLKRENVSIVGVLKNNGQFENANIKLSFYEEQDLECEINGHLYRFEDKYLNFNNIGEVFYGMMWPHWINTENN